MSPNQPGKGPWPGLAFLEKAPLNPCVCHGYCYFTDLTQPNMAALEIPDDLTHF